MSISYIWINKGMDNTLPFLSHIIYQDKECVCIILNSDDKIISFYDFSRLRSDEEQTNLLALGEFWWYESNRLLPINIFIREEMKAFRHCITTSNKKDVEVVSGPCTSLNDLIRKRLKKRQIQLVKRVK